MSSKREMLRKMNQKNNSKQEQRSTTLVTELVENFAEKEDSATKGKTSSASKAKKPEKKPSAPAPKPVAKPAPAAPKSEPEKENIDTSDLVGTARRRVSMKRSRNGAEKLQSLNRTTISLSENNEEYVMSRCEETGASITVTINKIIQEYRELKGIK